MPPHIVKSGGRRDHRAWNFPCYPIYGPDMEYASFLAKKFEKETKNMTNVIKFGISL
jgi:hypothetical protein